AGARFPILQAVSSRLISATYAPLPPSNPAVRETVAGGSQFHHRAGGGPERGRLCRPIYRRDALQRGAGAPDPARLAGPRQRGGPERPLVEISQLRPAP